MMRSPQNCGGQEPANRFVRPSDPVATERPNGRLAISTQQAQTDPTGPAPLVQAWKRHSPMHMMDTTPEFHLYEPSKGHGLPHDPFKAIVAPRPIGWISIRDAEGGVNLAPYSFFNAACALPANGHVQLVGVEGHGVQYQGDRRICLQSCRPSACGENEPDICRPAAWGQRI